jgi:Flp pilus assembly protein TadG
MQRFKVRGEHGAASVEFALISILLLAIVFGIIELGIYMFDQHVLTNASREGARTGIVMSVPRVSDEVITLRVQEFAQDHMVNFNGTGSLTVTVTPDETSRGAILGSTPPPFGSPLVVTVTYPFDFLFLSSFGFGPITMTAETRMRME